MWQYSSKGSVAGINGNVDKDYAYTDFAVIKEKGFNGWNAADYKPDSDKTSQNPAVQPANPETPTPEEAENIFEQILKQVQEINNKLDK
jgi:GH25 family lysozyme M1 (1,4-beta-N-acetylmuramidase)